MFTMDVSSRIINSIAASKTRAVQRFRAVVCIVFISFISFVRLAVNAPRAENHMEQVEFFLSEDVSLWFSMSISRHQQAASWPLGDQRLRDHAGPRQACLRSHGAVADEVIRVTPPLSSTGTRTELTR